MAPQRQIKPKNRKDKLVGIKKTRRLFTYKKEDLDKAIDGIKNKGMGIREACRVYGVPKTTVIDRVSGKVSAAKRPKVGPDPVLGHEYEERIKNWVLDMARCGFPIQKKDLLDSVSKIIKDTGIKNPFKDGTPGDTWYSAFLRRHPDVSVREPEGINNARAAVTETRIRSWFNDLREHIKSMNCLDIFEQPERIFNGDETGFSLCPKTGKVLGPKGYKNLYVIKKNCEKENLTVLAVFSAAGKLCPPLVVFPYIRPPKALVDSMPESWILGRSESGWMRSDVFFKYVCNTFNSWLIEHGIKKPVILFIDGHKSHMTLSLSEFCEGNGIILYALPPNTTHILQPADVSVFKPLKQEWKKTVKNWQSREENINKTITKLNFCKVLEETFATIHLETSIINGFRKCGLYPLNEDAVDYTKCVRDTIQKRIRTSNQNKNTPSVKDYDIAVKVISSIRDNLCKYNIDVNIVLTEIENAKSNRRSKSNRNSASSNMSCSILAVDTAATPDNLSFEEALPPTSDSPPCRNIDILNAEVTTDATLQQFITEESIENFSVPDAGSFISLDNISVMPLAEIEISQETSQINPQGALDLICSENQSCSLTVLAEIQEQPNTQTNQSQSNNFDDVFARHLKFPELPQPKQKNKGPKLPSAISSTAWRKYYEKKEEEKENLVKEKNRKKQLRAEVKEKKAEEKANKIPRKKKTVQKSTSKKTKLQCSKCSEDLVSDVEDDSEKNIGCDKCERWYHLKCTILKDLAYIEAATSDYTCQFC